MTGQNRLICLPLLGRAGLIAVAAYAIFAAAPAQAQSVRITVIGDSNVAGTGVFSSERYPEQLEAALKARGLDVSVSNEGRNGEVSAATASRASSLGSGSDVVVLWQACRNDQRQGSSIEACRANNTGVVAALKSQGVLVYVIRQPVYDWNMHRNSALTLGGQGITIDYRDGRGAVPDGHFNGAGYATIVKRTVEPIRKLVQEAKKKKAG